jgi:hypothetical protein
MKLTSHILSLTNLTDLLTPFLDLSQLVVGFRPSHLPKLENQCERESLTQRELPVQALPHTQVLRKSRN